MIDVTNSYRDVHNDHGLHWSLTKPPDVDFADLYSVPENPEYMKNFQDVYHEHQESVNELWRIQQKRARRSKKAQESSDMRRAGGLLSAKPTPSQNSAITIGSEYSVR